ncbi:MAG: hypothetical protein NZZ41_08150, partial [Candidatus Dojkabacteria bacterium]|nr:hypothetical protein [Candidatus Dojkabacteria bacterium]
MLVDSNGLILNVKVLPANISDSLGARILLCEISSIISFLKVIFADSNYDKTGLISYISSMTDIALMIVKNINNNVKSFIV